MKEKLFFLVFIFAVLFSSCNDETKNLTSEEARAIAKEVYIFSNQLANNQRIMYNCFVDITDPEYQHYLINCVS